MKTSALKNLLLGLIILYLPVKSMAWGAEGHRIAGLIAQSYLTPKTRAAVKAILGDTSIAIASNWADFIKSDPNYNYLSSWHYTTAAQRTQWQHEPISKWIFESNQIADKLYDEVKSGDTLNGFKYNFTHIAVVNRQLLKAGVRLAGVLNQIFG